MDGSYIPRGDHPPNILRNCSKGADLSAEPFGSVFDLDNEEITAVSKEWAKTLADRLGVRLTSYNPSETTAPTQNL
jgi:hypothetical protein